MKLMKYKLPVAKLGLIVAVVSLNCATTPHVPEKRDQVPDAGYLRARVELLYSAEQREDWRAWQRLASPELMNTPEAKEEFEKMFSSRREFKVAEWRVRSIRLKPVPEEPKGADAAAAVAMDVWVEDVAGGQRRKEDDQTDYWVHMGSEWFWVWRGWPDD